MIILSCSSAKCMNSGPAFKLYDGPLFRIFRRNFIGNFKVWILSAKYGFIRESQMIEVYDQRMNDQLAARHLISAPKDFLEDCARARMIYAFLGKDYLKAVPYNIRFSPKFRTMGGLFKMTSNLKKLLTGADL